MVIETFSLKFSQYIGKVAHVHNIHQKTTAYAQFYYMQNCMDYNYSELEYFTRKLLLCKYNVNTLLITGQHKSDMNIKGMLVHEILLSFVDCYKGHVQFWR